MCAVSDSDRQTEILAVDDCWKYLGSSFVGRLAVINGSSPEIFPINYVVLGRTLAFRTAPGTKLRALLTAKAVAVEADGLNAYATEVWSVVVKGIPMPCGDEVVNLSEVDPDRSPWEPGLKDHLVCIDPKEVSGRRFQV